MFWVGAVAELTGRTVGEVRDALGRLRVKELVLPHEPSSFSDEHEFSFRHNLIRDGAYDSLPKTLRADKHAGVARWAEQRAGDRADEIAELIATHLLEALRYLDELGETGESRRSAPSAFRWTRAAGERTSALWQRAEAARWFREAERLSEALGLPAAERVGFVRHYVEACWGTVPHAETPSGSGRPIFEALDDRAGVGWAWARLTPTLLMMGGRDEEAEAAGRTAIELLEPLGDRAELADALHGLGWFLWRRGRDEEAEPLLRRSVAMAEAVDVPVILAQAMQSLATCLAQTGRSAEAVRTMEEAYLLSKEVGDFTILLRASNNLPLDPHGLRLRLRPGGGGPARGDRARAASRCGRQPRLAGRARSPTAPLELGRPGWRRRSERERQCDRARRGSRATNRSAGSRTNGLAWAVFHAGQGRRGRRSSERRARRGRSKRTASRRPTLYVFATEASDTRSQRGREEEALEHLRRGVELSRGYTLDQAPLLFYELVRLLLRTGARAGAEGYRDLSEGGRAPATKAYAHAIEGLLAADPERAIDRLRAATGEFERLGLRIMQGRVLTDLGEALAQGRAPITRPALEAGAGPARRVRRARSTRPRSRRCSRPTPPSGKRTPCRATRRRRSSSSTSSTHPAATWPATWPTSPTCSAVTSSSPSRRWERGSPRYELTSGPPVVLLTDHVPGDRAEILVYRVADLVATLAQQEAAGWVRERTFDIPHGPCCSFVTPGGHRVALYQLTRPEAAGHFDGRRDF